MQLCHSLSQELKMTKQQKLLQKYSLITGITLDQSLKALNLLEFAGTNYYFSLIDNLIQSGNEESAKKLLLSLYPNNDELNFSNQIDDGIGEDNTVAGSPIISKFFDNRVLITVNNKCPQYCRYCFRRRRLGKSSIEISDEMLDNAFSIIEKDISKAKKHKHIHIDEIILSGGEPLILPYHKLVRIINRINSIGEIRTCRIDTKTLSVNPKAITIKLIKLISSLNAPYLLNHFIHPAEITEDVKAKVDLLLKYGIIPGAHIPILKSINDDYQTIKKMVNDLYASKIRPYYLIQFIPTKWNEHFRVSIEKSIKIRERLLRECSGLSIPSLVVYLPEGKGKAIINSSRDVREVKNGFVLFNTSNEEVFYEEKI